MSAEAKTLAPEFSVESDGASGVRLVKQADATTTKTKKMIREAFDLFDKDRKGSVVQEEIPTMIRFLGAYPDEKELQLSILQMQEDEPVGFVTFERFEKKMLEILLPINDYEPNDQTDMKQAFLALDKERNGYITAETMTMLLTTKGAPFRPKEVEAFMKVAKDQETGRIYYDDYIALLTGELE